MAAKPFPDGQLPCKLGKLDLGRGIPLANVPTSPSHCAAHFIPLPRLASRPSPSSTRPQPLTRAQSAMFARGALCRLAADAPKTSTHDLPRVSQLLRTTLFARHGVSQPTFGAIARAFRATIIEGRRTYATKSETTPTARVKREVKKAVATKKTAKTAATKKATTKKAAPKKKAVPKKKAKKAAPKKPKKRVKKELTAEEKQAEKLKTLKARALLKGSPKQATVSAWTMFMSESLKGSSGLPDSQARMKDAVSKFKNFTPAEREVYAPV